MMFMVPDIALERRRAQNRIAQRRFREKKNRRKAAASNETESTPPVPAPEQHAPILDQPERPTSPGPEDRWWPVEPAATIGESIVVDPSPPISHAGTASPTLESTPVPSFNVSKGPLLAAQGLLMGDLDFLSFDQDLELLDRQTHGRSSATPLLTPPSYRSASPVETVFNPSERNRDGLPPGAAETPRNTHAHTHPAPPPPLPPDNRTRTSRPCSGPSRRASTTAVSVDLQPRAAEDPGAGRRSDDKNSNNNIYDWDETPWLGPLHLAAVKGHDRIVRILLGHTADANGPDGHGRTPMMHAVAGGFEDVLQTLLAHGACAAAADRAGRSALHWAVAHRRESLLRRLLNHCHARRQGAGALALLDRPDNSGRTPLHLAIDIGFEAGVLLLLEHGANPSLRAPCAMAEGGL